MSSNNNLLPIIDWSINTLREGLSFCLERISLDIDSLNELKSAFVQIVHRNHGVKFCCMNRDLSFNALPNQTAWWIGGHWVCVCSSSSQVCPPLMTRPPNWSSRTFSTEVGLAFFVAVPFKRQPQNAELHTCCLFYR